MISHIWFESQFPTWSATLRDLIDVERIRVVTGPHPRRGGETPDPYLGLVASNRPDFAVAIGCRNNNSVYGSRPYAYVGVRSFPEFGGRGSYKIRGTLQEGVDWCRANQNRFLGQLDLREGWQGADFQWAAWKYVPTAAPDDLYAYSALLLQELTMLTAILQ